MSATDRTHYVYRAFDAAGRLLYIGCSKNLDQRRVAHRSDSAWWPYAARFAVTGPYPKSVALDLETNAIETEGSAFNGTSEDRRAWLRWSRAYTKAWNAIAPTHPPLEDEQGYVIPELLDQLSRLATEEASHHAEPYRGGEGRLADYLAEVTRRAA